MHDHQDGLVVTTVRPARGEIVVRVIGELDIRTAPTLSRAVHAALGEQPTGLMLLDLAGVSFCDHAGLRALHTLGDGAGPATVRVIAAHPAVDTILRLCGIDTFLGHSTPMPSRIG